MKLADLFIKLGLKSGEYTRGIDQAQKKTNTFKDGLKKIGGIIAGAFAAQKIVAFASELVKLGGEAQGVRAAFNRIADDRILDGLKDAVKGTVSELELMKRAVTANNLGIPIQNLAKLFEFATKRAQDTGESVDYLVNSIVTGIGRKSPLILDNLGISAIQLREKLKGVGMETASVGDIAKAVGEIAADAMEESGGMIDTNVTKLAKLNTEWEDFKVNLAESEGFAKVMAGSLQELIDVSTIAFSEQISGWKKVFTIAFGSTDKWAEIADEIRKIEQAELNRAAAFEDATKYEDNAYRNKIENELSAGDATKKHIKTIGDLKTEIETLKASLDLYGISQSGEIQRTLREIEAKEKLIKTLTTLKTKREDTSYFTPMTGQKGTPKIGDTMAPMPSGLGDTTSYLAMLKEQHDTFYAEMKADETLFLQQMNDIAKYGMVDLISTFMEGFGRLAAGDIGFQEFADAILSQIGAFLKQMGEMLIAYGIGMEAFKKAFTNPIAAIAAGVALVAIGGAIAGMASRGPAGYSGGGGVSTATSAGAGYGIWSERNGTQYQQGSNNYSTFLRGTDILLSQKRLEIKNATIG